MQNEIIIMLGGCCFVLGLLLGSLAAAWYFAAIAGRKEQRAARKAWKLARTMQRYDGEVQL